MTGRRIWVTRTDPFNRLTAKRLAAAGFEPVVAPVLRVIPIAVPPVMTVPDALVFTSLNGARLHNFFPGLASIPVFTVGDHSARFTRALGYCNVRSASGNVQDLCRILRDAFARGANLLHVGALRVAGDLGAMLGADFRVERLAVYAVEEREPSELEGITRGLDAIDRVLVHSPRAAQQIARVLAASAPEWGGAVHCISRAAAAYFCGLPPERVLVAERPDEPSMLKSLLEDQRLARPCGFLPGRAVDARYASGPPSAPVEERAS